MTWHPSGANEESSREAHETRTMLRGASTPRSQSATYAHWAGNVSVGAVGKSLASMPMWRCRNEAQRSTRPILSSSSATSAGAASLIHQLACAHRSQLLMTALRARMTRPSRVRTPAARLSSTRSESMCVLRRTSPCGFRDPRMRASTIDWVRPLKVEGDVRGKSRRACMPSGWSAHRQSWHPVARNRSCRASVG